jgi:hypothetical protein
LRDPETRFPPETLRQYALLADGERGALVGPRGDIGFLCAPRWHDDAVFSSLLGGPGTYAVTPHESRFVWGGHYEQRSLIWRSRWVGRRGVTECREALAMPTQRDRLVLLRRVEAREGPTCVRAVLDVRAGFGAHAMTVRWVSDSVWEGRSGSLVFRWSGVPTTGRMAAGALVAEIDLEAGQSHDLVLEISRDGLPARPPDPAAAWAETEEAWRTAVPDLGASVAPGESEHSYAVLHGLTSMDGGMVAAATTSLPERADQGTNYDYRYAWIRDQSYAGLAADAVDATRLLATSAGFVTDRVLEDGRELKPAYTVDGGRVPDERTLDLPGYPGAPVRIGNHVNAQFQLDGLGESLLLLAAAARRDVLPSEGLKAVHLLVEAIAERHGEPDAGIWELENRRWAHSRLACVAGLRAVGQALGGSEADDFRRLAALVLRTVERDCLRPEGRWQRAADDPRVDSALLIPGIRGAIPPDDPRTIRTRQAILDELTDDGHVYRFQHRVSGGSGIPLHEAEGAFVLSGFHMSMALLATGDVRGALRFYERNRGALGPPGLFAEEYDVIQRQLRGNLPQAFVHAAALEAGRRLADAGVSSEGFEAARR